MFNSSLEDIMLALPSVGYVGLVSYFIGIPLGDLYLYDEKRMFLTLGLLTVIMWDDVMLVIRN